MLKKYLKYLIHPLLWAFAIYCILATLHWVPPGFSIQTAEFMALGYLLLGIIFLGANRARLMLTCFFCSAAISFFLHEITITSPQNQRERKMPPRDPDLQSAPTLYQLPKI